LAAGAGFDAPWKFIFHILAEEQNRLAHFIVLKNKGASARFRSKGQLLKSPNHGRGNDFNFVALSDLSAASTICPGKV